jgi:hypothetical protein
VASVREQIQAKAREYIGTPFHQQARIKNVGLDCVGIVLCVGEDLGLKRSDGPPIGRFDYLNYGLFPRLDEMQTEAEKIFVKKAEGPQSPKGVHSIDFSKIIPGDILTMRAPFLVHHMAIVSQMKEGLGIIHAYGSERIVPKRVSKVVEHLLTARWKSLIAGVFSYSGVDG